MARHHNQERHAVAWAELSRPIVIMGREYSRLGLAEPSWGDFRGGLNVGALLGSVGTADDGTPDIDPLRADLDQWATLLTRIGVPRPTMNDVQRMSQADFLAVYEVGVPLLLPSETETDESTSEDP